MKTAEDISLLLVELNAKFKKNYRAKKNKTQEPEPFSEALGRSVEMYERIRVHSQSDRFPERLFREKAPNQTDAEWQYQKRLFKAIGSITNPYWDKALGAVNRIWNEKNYSIRYPDIESTAFINYPAYDYFVKDYPTFGSVEQYFAQVVTRVKLEDPNAWLVTEVLPQVSDNEPPSPYAKIYRANKVVAYHDGDFVLVITEDKSKVMLGGKAVKEGIVMRLYNRMGIYEYKQAGNLLDFDFSAPEMVYEYNFDTLPAWRLKGKPTEEDGETVYESYFYPAIPSLNSALIDFSTSSISKVAHLFPERWEYINNCDADGCFNGYVDTDKGRTVCGICHGTGKRNLSSALSVIQVDAPQKDMPGAIDSGSMTIPPAGYISKVESDNQIKLLIEEVDKNISRAFAMLNIDVSNSTAQGSDTALGKQIDREELFSFLLAISQELFQLLYDSVNAMGIVRYGDAWKPLQLGAPQSFAIRSDADLTEEISQAKTSGMPDIAVQTLLRQYADTRFNSQEEVGDIFSLVFAADRLVTLSQQEITQKLITRTVQPWEAILHDSINYFIEDAIRLHQATEAAPTWFDKPMIERVAEVQAMAMDKADEMTPQSDPNRIIEGA